MVYKTLKKVSDYCQLFNKDKYPATTTQSGVTFTNNGDGTITLNGTATARTGIFLCSASAVKGHKYLLSGCPEGGASSKYYFQTSWENDYGSGKITTFTRDATSGKCYITVHKDFVCSNLTFKPQLFDLTEMYGAGNEPTTVAEFREKFPNELYDYKPYSFLSSYKNLLKANDNTIITSYKKSLICTTKNLFDKTAVRTDKQGYDLAHCILIETTDNGWVVKGNVGSTPGSQYNSSGWFSPLTYAQSYTPEKCISLKAGDIVTISAYYTVLENNATTKAGIYIGGTELKSVVSITLPEVGVRTRVSQKYTISKDGIYRPVFTLNSSKILIENIQVEYGATPTEYHSYGYL